MSDERSFSTYAGDDNVVKFYFEDRDLESRIIPAQGKILRKVDLTYDPEKRLLFDNNGEVVYIY